MVMVLTVHYQCIMEIIMILMNGQLQTMQNLDIHITRAGGLISLMDGIVIQQLVQTGECIH